MDHTSRPGDVADPWYTAVKLTLQELDAAAGAEGWVDVCKEPEGE